MPELPEVETIANGLKTGRLGSPSILGRTITAAHLHWGRTLETPSEEEFEHRIVGQTVQDIGRRGKFLLIQLSEDVLVFHLRMSGDLLVEPLDDPVPAHHRLVLDLSGGLRLAFNDTRKFGRAWLVKNPQDLLAGLGPEPLDSALTPPDFYHMLHSRQRLLKPLLLDQSFLAGIGNIYADEALHLARLHPLMNSQDISFEQAERLLDSIRRVLQQGILTQGASIDWVYRGGDFQNHFRAYGRTGEPCPNCGTPIAHIIVGQRSTHYCPNCQRLP